MQPSRKFVSFLLSFIYPFIYLGMKINSKIIKGNTPDFAFLLTKALKKHNVMDLQMTKLPFLKWALVKSQDIGY